MLDASNMNGERRYPRVMLAMLIGIGTYADTLWVVEASAACLGLQELDAEQVKTCWSFTLLATKSHCKPTRHLAAASGIQTINSENSMTPLAATASAVAGKAADNSWLRLLQVKDRIKPDVKLTCIPNTKQITPTGIIMTAMAAKMNTTCRGHDHGVRCSSFNIQNRINFSAEVTYPCCI